MKRAVVIFFALAAIARAQTAGWEALNPSFYWAGSLANSGAWPAYLGSGTMTNFGKPSTGTGRPMFVQNTNQYFRGGTPFALTNSFVMAVEFSVGCDTNINRWIVGAEEVGAINIGDVSLELNSRRNLQFFCRENTGPGLSVASVSSNSVASNGTAIAVGVWNVLTKSATCWLDGVKGPENTNTLMVTLSTPPNLFVGVRGLNGNLTQPFGGEVRKFAVWNNTTLNDAAISIISQRDTEANR